MNKLDAIDLCGYMEDLRNTIRQGAENVRNDAAREALYTIASAIDMCFDANWEREKLNADEHKELR